MKQALFKMTVATAIALALTACESFNDSQSTHLEKSQQHYNIVLVVDGTDNSCHKNLIPEVTPDDVMTLTRMLTQYGEGTFYVTYVDESCKNNDFAILRWKHTLCPIALTSKDKASYEQQMAFNKRLAENQREIEQWRIDSTKIVQPFYEHCQRVLECAYCDEVTLKSKGSDVYGAINHALNMIESSRETEGNNYIVLVSDCEDNVGTQLDSIPDYGVKLLLVNGTSSKPSIHFEKKFVAIQQAVEYMFNK